MPLLLVFCALILAVGLLPRGLPSAGPGWDFLAATGYCGLAVVAYLGWDSESPAANPRLRLHRNLGVLASVLVSIHTFGYLLLDPTLIEYLKPTAPAYMLLGLAAGTALLVITVSSFPGPRRSLYRDFSTFRTWHRVLFVILIAGSLWHLLGTDFYLTGVWQWGSALAVLGMPPLGAYLARRARWQLPMSRPPVSTAAADLSAIRGGGAMLGLSALWAAIRLGACATC